MTFGKSPESCVCVASAICCADHDAMPCCIIDKRNFISFIILCFMLVKLSTILSIYLMRYVPFYGCLSSSLSSDYIDECAKYYIHWPYIINTFKLMSILRVQHHHSPARRRHRHAAYVYHTISHKNPEWKDGFSICFPQFSSS